MIKPILRKFAPEQVRWRIAVAREVFTASHSVTMTYQSQHVIHISAKAFGVWFTKHRTRWWEYPWVRREILARAPDVKLAAADLGAGKSPIPLVLARAGFHCTVVDRAQLEEMEGSSRGNEWDFVDYAQWESAPSVPEWRSRFSHRRALAWSFQPGSCTRPCGASA